ncbi:hypothetical protein BDZ45DRAFT_670125 [Acephala macrosclerotiorum]|nr:hypothetical protein BDZ45DRAFT_670125 [Acephala macrosclerotiorum]
MPPKKGSRKSASKASKKKKTSSKASSKASANTPPVSARSWQDIFLNYTIFDTISTQLNPRDLFALRATTKQLAGSFDTLFKTQWNINSSLGRFSRDPVRFRSMMAQCDALISGSFALQFFARKVWMDSDLDIYVQSGPAKRPQAFGQYLLAEEGYTLDNAKHVDIYGSDDPRREVIKVETYVRAEDAGHKSTIQIITTCTHPVDTILTSFYTTAVVNIITWQSAYAVFPDITFRDMKTFPLDGMKDYYRPLLEKYARRGWTTFEVSSAQDARWARSLYTDKDIRRVGDSLSWKIALDTNDVVHGGSDYVLEFSTFNLFECGGGWYRILWSMFQSCVLQHRYFNPQGRKDDFWFSIGPKLEKMSEEALSKLKDRPKAIPQSLKADESDEQSSYWFLYAGDIHKNTPKGWTYYDDEIPKWFEEWQKQN